MRETNILFFTATIKDWNHLLKPDKYKKIIIESLKYLVNNNKIFLYAFVIMPNHLHVIWKIREPFLLKNVQRDFLKYISQMIKYDLSEFHPKILKQFKSERKDRAYQFWQDRSYNTMLYNRNVIVEKIDYIHNNPMTKHWKLTTKPEEYYYSSAKYYLCNKDDRGFITNYTEHI